MSSISPELWRRIEPLLEQAFALEGEERDRFLQEACADDAELRSEMTALLAADGTDEGFLSQAFGELSPTLLGEAISGGSSSLSHPGDRPEDRYPPGTVLADRFRILTSIGRGGMGVVYRADDLRLGVPVALKFLPDDAERDPDRLESFLNEARMALKVSHPNVTRIHDIGEVDGHHYLSMQYVDGEDLASLLLRIGRLPEDKAAQVGRQLCAGLAAAHDQGVLHRDLKPANVMIDGRGQVKITDFGLAALDESIRGADAFAGTPQYMSPEQWAGREVSRQSDLYSLGLVLYETFTGRAAFAGRTPAEIAKAHHEGKTTTQSPSTIVEGIDPMVERAILQCLDPDPAKRPRSARAVAAALPGGDPLAAAIAAGETPSPEMVAGATIESGFSPRLAWAALVGVVVLFGLAVSLAGKYQLIAKAGLDRPPAVLAHQAGELLDSLGFDEPVGDRLTFFSPDRAYHRYLAKQGAANDRWRSLGQSQPAAYRFWYRQSRSDLARIDPSRVVYDLKDPPLTEAGMIELALDKEGRLLSLIAVPDPVAPTVAPRPALDSAALFRAAGLDLTRFEPVAPQWAPPVFAEERWAWEGVYPEAPSIPLRVEAAGLGGRPVAFRMFGPWDPAFSGVRGFEARGRGRSKRDGRGPFDFLYQLGFLAALVGAAVAAVRNLRQGRGDRKTAQRFALLIFGLRLSLLLGAHHFSSINEIWLLFAHLAQATAMGVAAWLFYLAFEPYARRLWPHMLTTWVRFFEGRLRDPLVARDLLLGVLVGLLNAQVRIFGDLVVNPAFGQPQIPGFWSNWSDVALQGIPQTIVAIVAQGPSRMAPMLGFVVLLTIFRLLTRRTWAALILVSLIPIVGNLPRFLNPLVYAALFGITITIGFVLLFRIGVLSYLTLHSVLLLVWNLPLTADPSSWYFATTVAVGAFVLGIAGWGFYHSLAGHSALDVERLVAARPAG